MPVQSQQDRRRRRVLSPLTLRNSSWSPPASSAAAASPTVAATPFSPSFMFAHHHDVVVVVTTTNTAVEQCPSTIQWRRHRRRRGSLKRTHETILVFFLRETNRTLRNSYIAYIFFFRQNPIMAKRLCYYFCLFFVFSFYPTKNIPLRLIIKQKTQSCNKKIKSKVRR